MLGSARMFWMDRIIEAQLAVTFKHYFCFYLLSHMLNVRISVRKFWMDRIISAQLEVGSVRLLWMEIIITV